MPGDVQHRVLPRPSGEVEHAYGPKVHLLSHPWPMSILARLASPGCVQPEVGRLVAGAYDWLLGEVAGRFLPTRQGTVETRMSPEEPAGVYEGELLQPDAPVVVVDVARAGMVPAARCFEALCTLLNPAAVRQDHLYLSRVVDAGGRVVGTSLVGSKIGGSVAGATMLVPDPMGATGGSICRVLEHYAHEVGGGQRRVVTMHLVVTPEYLRRITEEHPEVHVVAVRLDRGLSPPEVLACRPGERWLEERGLNRHQYIVPGAGGLGEVLNNAWV